MDRRRFRNTGFLTSKIISSSPGSDPGWVAALQKIVVASVMQPMATITALVGVGITLSHK